MDIKCFTNFGVLILVLIVTLTTVFLPNSIAQNYTQWDLPEGTKARLGKGTITEIAYSPDGTRLAVSGSRGVWIYDAQSGDELDLLTGHQGELLSVSYSPDGQTLASGSLDGIIRLWDADTGTLKHALTGHSQSVQ